jgi:hypothetical protein
LPSLECSHGFKGFLTFAVLAWVNSAGKQLAGRISAVARILEAHIGVDAKGGLILFAVDALFQPEPVALGRVDKQEHSFPSDILKGLGRASLCGLRCLSVAWGELL